MRFNKDRLTSSGAVLMLLGVFAGLGLEWLDLTDSFETAVTTLIPLLLAFGAVVFLLGISLEDDD